MKSAEAVGPSKNASQDWLAGLMRRLRPSLVISTWRTFGGKVMDFGKRTAWLRLVVNTVERVTLLLHFFNSWDIPLEYPTGIYVTVLFCQRGSPCGIRKSRTARHSCSAPNGVTVPIIPI